MDSPESLIKLINQAHHSKASYKSSQEKLSDNLLNLNEFFTLSSTRLAKAAAILLLQFLESSVLLAAGQDFSQNLGNVTKRSGGVPMKLEYYISPYEKLKMLQNRSFSSKSGTLHIKSSKKLNALETSEGQKTSTTEITAAFSFVFASPVVLTLKEYNQVLKMTTAPQSCEKQTSFFELLLSNSQTLESTVIVQGEEQKWHIHDECFDQAVSLSCFNFTKLSELQEMISFLRTVHLRQDFLLSCTSSKKQISTKRLNYHLYYNKLDQWTITTESEFTLKLKVENTIKITTQFYQLQFIDQKWEPHLTMDLTSLSSSIEKVANSTLSLPVLLHLAVKKIKELRATPNYRSVDPTVEEQDHKADKELIENRKRQCSGLDYTVYSKNDPDDIAPPVRANAPVKQMPVNSSLRYFGLRKLEETLFRNSAVPIKPATPKVEDDDTLISHFIEEEEELVLKQKFEKFKTRQAVDEIFGQKKNNLNDKVTGILSSPRIARRFNCSPEIECFTFGNSNMPDNRTITETESHRMKRESENTTPIIDTPTINITHRPNPSPIPAQSPTMPSASIQNLRFSQVPSMPSITPNTVNGVRPIMSQNSNHPMPGPPPLQRGSTVAPKKNNSSEKDDGEIKAPRLKISIKKKPDGYSDFEKFHKLSFLS